VALIHWLRLSLTNGIGPILTSRLIAAAGTAEQACEWPSIFLQEIDGIGTAKARHIAESLKKSGEAADEELAKATAAGARIICPDDDEYPVLLKTIPDPPLVLYIKGAFEPRDLNSIGIVGSRQCSIYGREQAQRFGSLLAGAAMTVVSGGARGIDSSAHRGAMEHPAGRTVAVLGCGVDVVFPPENAALFQQIATRGAVVSEYAMGSAPLAENFPKRNRIISGLSRGTLVIEAAARSGALITARMANEDQGRTVFALPGRVDNPLSEGTHQLLRDGATICTNLEDIMHGLGPLPLEALEHDHPPAPPFVQHDPLLFTPPPPSSVASAEISLTDRQQLVLSSIGRDATSIDAIIEQTGLAAQEVTQELTLLSLKALVKRVDGQQFVRKGRA